jgi:hypothetical protein
MNGCAAGLRKVACGKEILLALRMTENGMTGSPRRVWLVGVL